MSSDTALRRAADDGGRRLENLTLWERVHAYLREEIGRLAAEGLVTVRPRRGAVVRSLSKEEFLEAYQVREALEWMATKLAVPRLREDDLARLQALIDEM